MSTVVLYCWCHSNSASALLYFTLSFSTSSPELLNGFLFKLVGMKYSWSNNVLLGQFCQGTGPGRAKIGEKLLLQTGSEGYSIKPNV